MKKSTKIAIAKTVSVMTSVYSLGLLLFFISSPKNTSYIPAITIFVILTIFTFLGFLYYGDYGSIIKKIKY